MATTQPPLPERTVRERLRGQRGLLAAIVVAELLALIMVSTINLHDWVDGEVYQLGAKALVSPDGELYRNLPPTEGGLELPFIYPPFAAMLFAPLAFVPKIGAVLATMVVSHVALLITLYVLLSAAPFLRGQRDRIVLCTGAALPLMTITEPVVETITYAQVNIFLLALVVVDLLWRVTGPRRLPYPRGLLIGLAAGVKLTPLVFLLFPLLRRDVRTIVTSALSFLGTIALGFVFAPRDALIFWTSEVWATSDVSFGPTFTGDASVYAGNQSLRSFLTKAHAPGMPMVLAVVMLVVLMLTVLGMRYALNQADLSMAVMLNGVLGLLISPISWSHHWAWAVPTLLLLAGTAYTRRNWGLLLSTAMVSGFALIGPHWSVPQGDGEELRWNLFQHLVGNSYVYFGVAFIVYMAVLWWRDRNKTHAPAAAPASASTG